MYKYDIWTAVKHGITIRVKTFKYMEVLLMKPVNTGHRLGMV